MNTYREFIDDVVRQVAELTGQDIPGNIATIILP